MERRGGRGGQSASIRGNSDGGGGGLKIISKTTDGCFYRLRRCPITVCVKRDFRTNAFAFVLIIVEVVVVSGAVLLKKVQMKIQRPPPLNKLYWTVCNKKCMLILIVKPKEIFEILLKKRSYD